MTLSLWHFVELECCALRFVRSAKSAVQDVVVESEPFCWVGIRTMMVVVRWSILTVRISFIQFELWSTTGEESRKAREKCSGLKWRFHLFVPMTLREQLHLAIFSCKQTKCHLGHLWKSLRACSHLYTSLETSRFFTKPPVQLPKACIVSLAFCYSLAHHPKFSSEHRRCEADPCP